MIFFHLPEQKGGPSCNHSKEKVQNDNTISGHLFKRQKFKWQAE